MRKDTTSSATIERLRTEAKAGRVTRHENTFGHRLHARNAGCIDCDEFYSPALADYEARADA